MANKIQYNGGKGQAGVYQKIINQMPPHRVYIECFLGSGAILRHKKPAEANFGIDIDSLVIKQWREDSRFSKYLNFTKLVCQDAVKFLYEFPRTGNELVYCDPPYLMETRKSKKNIYRHEMTEEDHFYFIRSIKGLSNSYKIMISGYWSEIYEDAFKGWRSISYNTTTRGGGVVKEFLWMNYDEPQQLHDYSYLGDTFKQREHIKLKKERFKKKLLKLPTLERMALIGAVEEVKGDLPEVTPKTRDTAELKKSIREMLIKNGQQSLLD